MQGITEQAAHLAELAKPNRVFAIDHCSRQIVLACNAIGAPLNDEIATQGQ